MSKKLKVLVNGHDQKFWYPLQRELEATGKYIFKEDMWSGHNTHDEKKSQELLEWADIIICEWALGNAVYYTQRKLPHQKLLIRLHLQERDTEFPKQINYANVNAIIFVGQHILDECVQKFNIPKHITYLIPNIIDVKKFDMKKFGDADFTLGIVGIVPLRKRLDLAYETLKELQKIDKRYILRVKGASPASYDWLWARTKERAYYEKIYSEINASKLRHSVIFDPMGNDVAEWFQSVGYILSPSDFESFHVAPAEGMSSTTLPIIWKREGSSDIFPTVIKTDSPQLAAQQIDFYRRNKAGERYKQISKEFILNTFDSKVTSKKWAELLDQKNISASEDQYHDIKKKVIVFFAIGSWETFHRKEMIEALAKHVKNEYNILIIEPGNNFQAIVNNGMATENELLPMLQLKPTKVDINIFKIRIMNSGFKKGLDVSKILTQNSDYGEAIYAVILEMFGKDTETLYWIQKSLQYKWINQKCNFIFEIYDEYTMDFETGKLKKDVLKEENSVLPLAQHVFFTSDPLAYRKSSKTKSWSIVGNGVNFDIFAKYNIKDELHSPKRVSVGYLGNLSSFFNWELMCEVVETMPEIDFIFYGQLELEKLAERKVYAERLMSYKNTIFTGRVTREEGAVGINLVDVLVIPFVINDAMHAVNPLKLWEYFATGKPVISTPMDAIVVKEPLLRVASSTEEWITAIKDSLTEKDVSISEQRIKLAKANSWNTLTDEHDKILGIISEKKNIVANKVFVLGSCVSRDIFNFPHNYDLIRYCARTSFASIFSSPFGYAEYADKLSSPFQVSMLKDDLLKQVQLYLEKEEFDILLIDFIDERFNLIKNKNNAICSKSNELSNTGIFNEQNFAEEILSNSQEYIKLWEEGWSQFISLMKKRKKLHQVLLNKTYWSYETIQKTDFSPNISHRHIQNMNSFLDKLYLIAEKDLPKENIMSFNTSIIIADEKHRWGKTPYHYSFSYYKASLQFLNNWSSH